MLQKSCLNRLGLMFSIKMILLQQFQNTSKILMTYEHTMSFGNDFYTYSKHLKGTSELAIDFSEYISHSYI